MADKVVEILEEFAKDAISAQATEEVGLSWFASEVWELDVRKVAAELRAVIGREHPAPEARPSRFTCRNIRWHISAEPGQGLVECPWCRDGVYVASPIRLRQEAKEKGIE